MEYQHIPIDDITLDKENPRIRYYIEMYGEKLSSERIAYALSDEGGSARTSYDALKESIRVNKGIINPIIVNRKSNGEMVVIEGNTRLQLYREFREANPDGPWNKIIALVYDDIERENVHAIRLQTHLVGPREWEPFSKAKYLYQLSHVENLPLSTIISYCGGKQKEVNTFIEAYQDMMTYYKPTVEKEGATFCTRVFSHFAELRKNNSISRALSENGYDKFDFSKWVIHENLDTAQMVRKLPEILANKKATKEFLNTNATEAYKLVYTPIQTEKLLIDASLNDLVETLTIKLNNISLKEVEELQNDPAHSSEVNNIENLKDGLEWLLGYLQR